MTDAVPSRAPWAVLAAVLSASAAGAALLGWMCRDTTGLPVFPYDAPHFALTERSGRTITTSALRGRVWAVDFVFTRCQTICPRLHSRFFALREEVAGLTLVSMSVDPEHDTPEVLAAFARKYNLDKPDWLWLTGPKQAIFDTMQHGFKVTRPDESDRELHSEHVLLVDGRGRLRGAYAVLSDDEALARLKRDASALAEAERRLRPVRALPAVNACLNASSFVLLVAGLLFIKRRAIAAHRAAMVGACVASIVFLASYLTYHFFAGATRFAGPAGVRAIYLAILVSHTTLAIVLAPMVVVTLRRAISGSFERHRSLARWTLPMWLYVSLTGVAVYVMLYVMYPAAVA